MPMDFVVVSGKIQYIEPPHHSEVELVFRTSANCDVSQPTVLVLERSKAESGLDLTMNGTALRSGVRPQEDGDYRTQVKTITKGVVVAGQNRLKISAKPPNPVPIGLDRSGRVANIILFYKTT